MKGQFIYKDLKLSFKAFEKHLFELNTEASPEWEETFFNFATDWFSNNDVFQVQTSGSTGLSKQMTVQRKDLMLSAQMTIKYLKLEEGMTALHCLPSTFIAGKMMFVRALVGDLNLILVEPKRNPLEDIDQKVDFIAITPYQLHHILEDPNSKAKLRNIRKVIVGGAGIDPSHIDQIKHWENEVYSTYGMTETLSHIAMKRVNTEHEQAFEVINSSFEISLDERSCLTIHSPYGHMPLVKTNDVVELISDHSFKFLGRYDHVINSGGIKVFPEEIEKALSRQIHAPFIVSSIKDDALGEKIVLIVESEKSLELQDILAEWPTNLSTHTKPKQVFVVPKLAYTENQKVDRIKSRALINK